MSTLNLSLYILNLLPISILDGGQLLSALLDVLRIAGDKQSYDEEDQGDDGASEEGALPLATSIPLEDGLGSRTNYSSSFDNEYGRESAPERSKRGNLSFFMSYVLNGNIRFSNRKTKGSILHITQVTMFLLIFSSVTGVIYSTFSR